MNAFTDLFIRRPVLATVVSLLILLVGGMAAFRLQVRQFPETSNTTITITTTYPGAAADVIKGFITTPIEQAVASAEGIDTLVSTSQQNTSTITLNLRLDANPDRAMADTLSKVNQVRGLLPRDANDPVVVKQTGQGFALMYLSFNSEVMTPSQITDYLTRVVQPRLQTVDGVANAQILGGQTFAMRIWLDPTRMASLGVTPNDVRAALAANNFTTAAGEVKGDYTQISVNALTSLDSAKAFGQLVIATHGDALVRLGDVSKIELGPQSVNSSSVFDGLKAVFVGIYGTPEANPLTVIDGVRAIMPSIQSQLPTGLRATIAYDSTTFIRASIYEVAKTLAEAAAIVIVVIFLFLGNLRSTFIPIVTIPLSLIGVMIALMALGYSINLLTLLALVLGIGLVVDDAIVVVENIHRHIEEGMTPFDAAIRGAHEIALPIIAMTITLAAVYAPIGFVSGVTGVLFREFAFTLAGAVIVSGFIALTLSPMMCSKLLSREKNETWFARKLDSAFLSLRRAYKRRLHSSLNFRALTMLILVGVLALTAVMYATTPRELAPEEDQGILLSLIKTPQVGNLDYTEQATQAPVRRRARDARNLARLHHQRLRRRPQRLRRLSPQTLGRAEQEPEAGSGRAQPEIPRRAAGAGAGVFASGAARLDRRRADAIRHSHHRRLCDARRRRAQDAAGGARERPFPVHRRRPQVRHAATRVQGRRRQGQPHRRQHVRCRHGAGDDAGRQLRQSVQPLRPQLSGHTAGAARVPLRSRLADPLSGAHQKRRACPAVGGGDCLGRGAAQRADQLPAAQFRHPVGRAFPRPHARRRARFPDREIERDFPGRLHL